MTTAVELPPLAGEADLAGLPGAATLGADRLAVAGDDIRGRCGWHIAPVVTQTLIGSGTGRPKLLLPTLRPRLITSIRVLDDAGHLGDPLIGWRAVTGGMLYRPAGWPRGVDNVVVEAEHGFDTCPRDLLAALLAIAESIGETAVGVRSRARAKTVGDVSRNESTTYFAESIRAGGTGLPPALAAVLDRYRIPA